MVDTPGQPEPVVRIDFGFRRELAQKVEGNLVSACYQCGACVGDCPATTYGSGFNPREIMLKVLYGLADELLTADTVLWQCTNCYNCQERCPQEVKPVEVIIALKNMLADRSIYPESGAKVIHAFETTGRTTLLGPAVDREREKYGLPPLDPVPMDEIRLLLEASGPAPRSTLSTHLAATRQETSRRQAFFPGCLIPVRHPAMEFAIRSALPPLGVELVDLEGASCCPDPIYFKSKDKLTWLAVAARNLTLAEEKGLDIVTNCSGCTATLSEASHLLEDAALREQVDDRLARIGRRYAGTSRVRHVVTVLRDVVGLEAVRKSVVRPLEGLKVALHYGCHLLKPSRTMQVDDPNDPHVLEDLVTALGATPVRHRHWSLCCGKACQSEDLPARMMHDLLTSVSNEQADLLCLVCPTCFGQFDHGQLKVARQFSADFHTPPVYFLQLLAFAQGIPYDRLGFEKQRIQPEVLRRFEA
jgi:heterodisulfide reductase subunit B